MKSITPRAYSFTRRVAMFSALGQPRPRAFWSLLDLLCLLSCWMFAGILVIASDAQDMHSRPGCGRMQTGASRSCLPSLFVRAKAHHCVSLSVWKG